MLKRVFILLFASLLLPSMATAAQHAFTAAQQQYLDAQNALRKGHMNTYRTLRKQLDNYPLAVYLDYQLHQANIPKLKGNKAQVAIERFSQTPFYDPLRHRYLKRAGKQKRWQDFLRISPTLPRDTELQCYYYRAQLQQGNQQLAFAGAKNLWLHGYSQPKACDILFREWQKAGHRTQALIWQRMLLAFDARQYGLLSWLSRKITAHQPQAKALLAVYRDPKRLRHIRQYQGKATIVGDIVDAGLRRLARRDINQAVKLYQQYQKQSRFSTFQSQQLNHYLVRRVLIRQETSLAQYVDMMLPLLNSDELIEMRLRWAIREQNMTQVAATLPLLSNYSANKARWRYWQARIAKQPSQQKQLLTAIASERNFYGFVAAHQLGIPISLNEAVPKTITDLQRKLKQHPSWQRLEQLQSLNKTAAARAEWRWLLKNTPATHQGQLLLMAEQRRWHALGVQGSILANSWNYVRLRFPLAYANQFHQAAAHFEVNSDEIRAIARRESTFNPLATSPVGARGLMQLMPATARATARANRLPYSGTRQLYQVDLNINLGTAYYSELLQRFNDNRILATAAYNAGPGNVKRWLRRSQGRLDAIAFIESMPFQETRDYVKAVFSYRMIYEFLQHKATYPLLSDNESQYQY